ncbi:putative bifunctional diguanylate cyclase/phosphodiesterase [Dyella acidiphila]|uniref:EAL domain-containing protein n=1 Tax=Dyella acidiphila TaxID=2775866 RepID=A0ABR9GCM8_9GAMM|nr:bifunctional diguanylate cyclase/phosphodiesterase [Dyella acidiphila]MBE1161796.1 EAL domain-containing protein [Dyella acidiphila]
MVMVFSCLVHEHNIGLVLAAILLCIVGSWVTARLLHRTLEAQGVQRIGWYFLTALAAGVAIWCTHFVAMLGYRATAPVSFDASLTVISLLIAIAGSTAGFVLASSKRIRWAPIWGGALVGLAISAMHYIGMLAYQVQASVSWDRDYLLASVAASVLLSAWALQLGMRHSHRASNQMAAVLALAIVILHFTGMAAFRMTPWPGQPVLDHPSQFNTLAWVIAGMAVLVIIAGLVSYLLDNRARVETMERLRRMALQDALTELPNRVAFAEWLEQEIALAGSQVRYLALIVIDLNGFKEINDAQGHRAGDEVLRVLGLRLRNALRRDRGEFIARVGGDEFMATCRAGQHEEVLQFVERLRAVIVKPIHSGSFDIDAGASFGVAFYPSDANDSEQLISNADLAMYRAKAQLAQHVCFYEPGMDELVRKRRNVATELRKALDTGQLSIHYQVQTSVATGGILGYEALVRWLHPVRGAVPPAEFIPIAEESGLILQLGEWVLRQACAAAATWDSPCKVAVNLSPMQFSQVSLLALLKAVLEETGLAPTRLELELTESTIFMDRKHALELLADIKALGVSIALDDFGTGYSSLDILRSFSFDRIKIDASFVQDAESDLQTFSVIRAVLSLGKSLNIPVMAEGIETPSQFSMLKEAGCDEFQGFLLGRPLPLEHIVQSGQMGLVSRAV